MTTPISTNPQPTTAPVEIYQEAKELGIYLCKKIQEGRDDIGPDETINIGLLAHRAIDAATRELREIHTMQLAGIMTAAMQNTRKTVADRIDKSNPYWTVAYSDVCHSIDREIEERERADSAESRLAAAVLERDAARAECAVKESTITNREALIYADKWNALSQAITQELSILFKDIDQIDKGNLTPQDQGQAEITRLRQAVAALTRLQKILWPGSDLKIKASTDAHLTVVSRERLEQTERVLTDLLCLTKAVFWVERDKIAPENLKLLGQYEATALKLLGASARAKEGT